MRRAFTLIEVLLVLALIGLFTTLFMVNLESLMRETEADSVETAFWSATRDARTRALVDREPQLVRFDAKAAAFVVEAARSQSTRRVTIDRSRWAEDVKVEVALQKRLPASQFSLVRGQLVEVREVAAVQFFPDGTCTPFLVSLKVGRDERTIEIDPWTGSELLAADAS
jgi:general secretion pathway protein H